jgi:hypothetical protein
MRGKQNYLLSFKFKMLKVILVLVYTIIFKSLCVWPFIGSAPGHHRDLRQVSLEPVWPQVESRERNFPQKWPLAKLPNKMSRH